MCKRQVVGFRWSNFKQLNLSTCNQMVYREVMKELFKPWEIWIQHLISIILNQIVSKSYMPRVVNITVWWWRGINISFQSSCNVLVERIQLWTIERSISNKKHLLCMWISLKRKNAISRRMNYACPTNA
jgi:hypothetical protein